MAFTHRNQFSLLDMSIQNISSNKYSEEIKGIFNSVKKIRPDL